MKVKWTKLRLLKTIALTEAPVSERKRWRHFIDVSAEWPEPIVFLKVDTIICFCLKTCLVEGKGSLGDTQDSCIDNCVF